MQRPHEKSEESGSEQVNHETPEKIDILDLLPNFDADVRWELFLAYLGQERREKLRLWANEYLAFMLGLAENVAKDVFEAVEIPKQHPEKKPKDVSYA